MFSAKLILAAFAFAAVSSAAPPQAEKPAPFALMRGARPTAALPSPVVSDSCTSFTGGLSFLNKELSWVQVPGGFICTFFEDFGCINGGVNTHDVAVLTGGTWVMSNVQGIAGAQNFNDLTSSTAARLFREKLRAKVFAVLRIGSFVVK
ncbi:hypothetical protein B0H13DRAFT_1853933 [Mycena leptocephala]|nr:hypothetical protein B0H13DRAFT_1853933 [Mycena leptocephala]